MFPIKKIHTKNILNRWNLSNQWRSDKRNCSSFDHRLFLFFYKHVSRISICFFNSTRPELLETGKGPHGDAALACTSVEWGADAVRFDGRRRKRRPNWRRASSRCASWRRSWRRWSAAAPRWCRRRRRPAASATSSSSKRRPASSWTNRPWTSSWPPTTVRSRSSTTCAPSTPNSSTTTANSPTRCSLSSLTSSKADFPLDPVRWIDEWLLKTCS